MGNDFSESLKRKMDEYAHSVYQATKQFPKEELYGIVSQLRRASLSVILNFVEGFARQRRTAKLNFWEIAYGSLKESKYLLHFSLVEKYMNQVEYERLLKLSDEIGAMLWNCIKSLK